jgi:flagellar motility protein MotE (MotC chaperone)
LFLTAPVIVRAQTPGGETPAASSGGNTLSEEERLKALQADIDKKIATYNDILTRLEELLSKVPEAEAARLKTLVKAYDSMSAEDAARNLSEIDEDLAVKILLKMNSRKAGAAMGQMEVKKAASLTEKMSTITKFLPVK